MLSISPGRLFASLLVCVAWSLSVSAQSSGSLKALEAAAAKGNTAAMYALGAAAEASGDIAKALTHFQAAADAGYAGAEFKLGEYYEQGRGVAVDLAMAKDWYRKAANQGLAQAIEKVNQLEGSANATGDSPVPEKPTARDDAPVVAVPNGGDTPQQTKNHPKTADDGQQAAPVTGQSSSPERGNEVPVGTSSSSVTTVAFFIPIVVGLLLGIIVWKAVRGAVLRWYRSRDFIVTGRTAVEMMTKEVGLRLQVEWIPLVAGFAVFVGVSVGGWKLLEVLFGIQL